MTSPGKQSTLAFPSPQSGLATMSGSYIFQGFSSGIGMRSWRCRWVEGGPGPHTHLQCGRCTGLAILPSGLMRATGGSRSLTVTDSPTQSALPWRGTADAAGAGGRRKWCLPAGGLLLPRREETCSHTDPGPNVKTSCEVHPDTCSAARHPAPPFIRMSLLWASVAK